MSRTSFGRPEYRLALDYPHITVTRPGAQAQIFECGSSTLLADLRRLSTEILAAGARLTVVLPEGEVWRGRLALDGTRLHNRGRTARSRAAEAMGLPAAALAVRLGRIGRDGTHAAAAVRRETLAETRGFLARAGLRPARITGAGDFEGFAEAPRFDAQPLHEALRPALPVAGGLVAAAALFAFLLRPDAVPPEAGLVGPMPVAATEAAEPQAPVVAELTPRARPADLVRVADVPEREPAAPGGAPGAPRLPATSAGLSFQPPVTMASRNMPVAGLPPVPKADSVLRLSELSIARARIAETLTSLPLFRSAAVAPAAAPVAVPVAEPVATPVATPVAAEPAAEVAEEAAAAPAPAALQPVTTAPRPQRRPVAAVAVPAPEVRAAAVVEAPAPNSTPPVATPPAAAPGLAAVAAPPPRPRDAGTEQVAQAVGAAVVVASLGLPDGVVQDAGSSLAAAVASVSRPEPRRATPAPAVARQPTRQPTRQAAAPTVARPAAAIARPAAQAPQRTATRPAAQPQRQRVAAVQPARQAPQRVVTVPARQAAPAAQTRTQARTQAQPQTRTQARAAAQPARQEPRRAAAAERPANSNATTSATAAAAATESADISRRSLALIGVFGPERDRYAMVRLPNGQMKRVRAGDALGSARIAGISANSVQIASGGRTTTLAMP